MNHLSEYLAKAQQKLGFTTKVQLARHLEMSPQELNRAQKDGYCSDEIVEKLADITDTPSVLIYTAREASKPQSEKMAIAWHEILVNLLGLQQAKKLFHADKRGRTRRPTLQETTDFLLKNQRVASLKDYRKYLFLELHQRLAALIRSKFPVIRQSGRPVQTQYKATQAT